MNKIYYGDNLDVLKQLYSEYPKGFIDLIYIDPPFNSNRNYNILFDDLIKNADEEVKNKALKEAFIDTWSNVNLSSELEELKSYSDNPNIYNFLQNNRNIFTSSQMSYLTMMAHRIYYMHKLLAETGSFYLHCDPTMSHYLKILLDIIFGQKNFRNEIVWQRNDGRAKGSQYKNQKYASNTDTIFFYSKTKEINFYPIIYPDNNSIDKKFSKIDQTTGKRYYTGIPIFCSPSMGSRPNLCYEWRGFKNPYLSGWRLSKDRLEEEYQRGNVVISEGNKLERRKYLNDYEGKILDNNWIDIPRIGGGRDLAIQHKSPRPCWSV